LVGQPYGHVLGVGAARRKLSGPLKTRDWKMQDWNYRHQTAGVENAGLENSGTENVWNATCGLT